jgi:hypothetical protein
MTPPQEHTTYTATNIHDEGNLKVKETTPCYFAPELGRRTAGGINWQWQAKTGVARMIFQEITSQIGI